MWELLLIPVYAYVATATVLWTLGGLLDLGRKEDIRIDEEAMEILHDLVNHGYCPREDGQHTTCAGCDEAIDKARGWLTKNDLLKPEDRDG